MNWRYLGSLLDARNSGCSGVYLIVHKGKYNRIVYVGVSNNVGRRISEHYEGYLRGNRTVYNAGKNDDVYSLMSAINIRNHIKQYQKLARNHYIWASTTLHSDKPKNLLAKGQSFSEQWQDITFDKYLPQLFVWALPISNYDYESVAKIESVIQKKLVAAFDLRGFFNVKQLSILGKIEYPKLNKYSLSIDPPDLDFASKILLSDLSRTGTPISAYKALRAQLKEELVTREKEKQSRISIRQKIQSQYKNSGKPWTYEDLEKLRVMIVDFKLSPLQMSPYLERAPSAIAKRIVNNDKLSNKKWREHIKWL
ncbi:GIY-YIG nuclease family protein [Thalassotalea hakodatensis]|uniref:GIY-YIG nuclease family protein n=1 Tax=Thalassotalea hakodatensis TaxID=3030492 RepID=UPI002573F717|nr:GIY-YIG nuclease family protein [Thalassotalea hakodatensis]